MRSPIPTKPSRFVQHIDRLINDSAKSQRQIAYEIGYEKPNLITMFKQGATRVPAEKVPLLADALGADRVTLLRMWMEEYSPELLTTIDENLGMALSRTERSWITNLRKQFHEVGMPAWDESIEEALRPIARSRTPAHSTTE